ncbi:TRAP transporter fused permease subunit [Salinibacillus xinjiangensis]|uniref:TRAP transporter fused permease subunit n=2 Tax=Salinibacillus xinjiangensis TaxID=1229268 RepID=A0A6G1X1H5_9BACI|nr:TRAP transporter fused permease subunit [Salinibacillus xinjiangensis]
MSSPPTDETTGKIDTTVNEEELESSNTRTLTGWVKKTFTIIAVIGAIFHLYILNLHPIDPWVFRSTHLVFGLVLGLMLYPGWRTKSNKVPIIDWILIIISIYVGYYIFANLEQLIFRVGVAPTDMDVYVALAGLLLVFEITRRTSGWVLPIIASVFVVYVFAGPYLPGILHHTGYSVERFVTYIYSLNGVFGVTLAVSSKYIILFIIFGAFLQKSGVGQYFINVAFSIAGGLRGGPAKVAIFSSGLMGMINGTSAGNVVATGSLTIPLMKKTGYPSRFAAATEATASAGGQLLPPIMGAGAFLMAEVTGIPYSEIIIAAIIPAVLYFISVYFMVDFQAIKEGLRGLPRKQLPSFKYIIKKVYLFIPVLLLIVMLVSGFSVIFAGTAGIISCFILSLLSKETRMSIKDLIGAFELGMRDSLQLIAIVACAGIIVGVISLTGVGQRFSTMLLSIADTNIFLALLFAMALAVLLGMGMPTTAAYAVAASTVAPGLINIGMEPLFAHMFVFYYAVISAITPPVALAAFAAAGISGTNPMKTGVKAFQIGLAAFIVPFVFVYSPELLLQSENIMGTILATVTAIIGVYLLAAAVQAWFFGNKAGWLSRLILLGASLMFIWTGFQTDIIAIALVVIAIVIQKAAKNSNPPHSEQKADLSQ